MFNYYFYDEDGGVSAYNANSFVEIIKNEKKLINCLNEMLFSYFCNKDDTYQINNENGTLKNEHEYIWLILNDEIIDQALEDFSYFADINWFPNCMDFKNGIPFILYNRKEKRVNKANGKVKLFKDFWELYYYLFPKNHYISAFDQTEEFYKNALKFVEDSENAIVRNDLMFINFRYRIGFCRLDKIIRILDFEHIKLEKIVKEFEKNGNW